MGNIIERIKKLPPLVWVAALGIVIGVLFLSSRKGGTSLPISTGTTTSGGGSSDGNSGQDVLTSTDFLAALSAQQQQQNDFMAALLESLKGNAVPPVNSGTGTTPPPTNSTGTTGPRPPAAAPKIPAPTGVRLPEWAPRLPIAGTKIIAPVAPAIVKPKSPIIKTGIPTIKIGKAIFKGSKSVKPVVRKSAIPTISRNVLASPVHSTGLAKFSTTTRYAK